VTAGSAPEATPGLARDPAPAGRTAGQEALDPVRRARAWLSRAVEPGSAELYRYVARLGPVEAVRRIRAGQAPASVTALAAGRRDEDQVERDLALARQAGIRLVVPEDPEWPSWVLLAMEGTVTRGVPDLAPPLALWVRGARKLDELTDRAVAIVGARGATHYGEHVATDLAYRLASRGWTVVSGGAFGIDAAAHTGALSADGVTAAVIAGGLDRPYPAGNVRLFDRIAESGLLLSEWPPGCAPQRHRFLIRNRLIAGLVGGTVVVEAGARSGARQTARRTRELGRPVMAVPGPVTSAMSVGSHQLIRAGEARIVANAAEVLEEVGRIGEDLAPSAESQPSIDDELDPVSRRVLDGVPARAAVSPERIARAAGVEVAAVIRCLPALELVGLVESMHGAWRLTPAARGRSAAGES